MADRRRINGPVGSTYIPELLKKDQPTTRALRRTRPADMIRKIYLQTGVTPSASGSAYLELSSGTVPGTAGLKLSCTVHGPRALPRSMPFAPHLLMSTHVKYAPFATKTRHGYVRDTSERDLAVHLETALRGAVLGDRWPKSGVDIAVTVIEADQHRRTEGARAENAELWETMNVLSGCITVASAALADAGIDCVDTVAGGMAAVVESRDTTETAKGTSSRRTSVVVDPVPAEHEAVLAACCVAYLPNRDEVTNLWLKGDLQSASGAEEDDDGEAELQTQLLGKALLAARQADAVLVAALKETVEDSG